MIGTTMTTTTGTIAKTAPTGVTWGNSTGSIVSSIAKTTEYRDITGIGATATQTAIKEGCEVYLAWSGRLSSGRARPSRQTHPGRASIRLNSLASNGASFREPSQQDVL
jgi:hypothetical protein